MKNATVLSLNLSVCKQLWPKIFQTQGLSQEEIVQWPCPLIDWLSGLLRKLSFLWAVLWASNMPKMHWRPGLPSPRPPSRLGRGTPPPSPHHRTSSAPRFSRFGASILVPPPRGSLVPHRWFKAGYGPEGRTLSTILGIRQLETMDYSTVRQHSSAFPHFDTNTGVWRTDGQADGHAVAYTALRRAVIMSWRRPANAGVCRKITALTFWVTTDDANWCRSIISHYSHTGQADNETI